MTILHIDYESRGVLDLPRFGLHNYARHPDTAPWCMGYAFDDEPPELWTPCNAVLHDNSLPVRVRDHVIKGGAVYAHNAPFELEIWNTICVPRYGWPELKPEQTFCTMAMAYAMGLPGALDDAAYALQSPHRKDAEGYALMMKYAKPWKAEPLQWMDENPKFTVAGKKYSGQEGLHKLYEYCKADVAAERELHKRLMPLSATERKVWLMDYAINQRGVKIDVASAKAALRLVEVIKGRCDAELAKVTEGAVTAASALPALKDWLAARGYPVKSLDKNAVAEMLLDDGLPADVRRAITLRSEAGKASTAKLSPMVECVGEDDRLRGWAQYHGAATGRWAARKVQPHNLPRDVPSTAEVEKILAHIRAGDIDLIDMVYGPPMEVLSKCLRGFFIPEDGHVLIAGDYANVEGRGVAWFSGEDWKVKAFREADAGTGPGLYELAYARMFGVDVKTVKNPSPERQKGKVAELAFGYQGGVGAARRMAPKETKALPDEVLDDWKDRWRDAHPKVSGIRTQKSDGDWYRRGGVWKELQNAAIQAVLNPGETHEAGVHPVRFKVVGSFLWCLLPSGRAICYPYPKVLPGVYGPMLTYMTSPSTNDVSTGRILHDERNTAKWARISTYGGSLMENVIQAICRDLLVHLLLWLHEAGAKTVLHVHDEGVVEVLIEKAEGARRAMQAWMRSPPAWAVGFPLYAECEIMSRYGKG